MLLDKIPTAEEIRRGWKKIDEHTTHLSGTKYTTWISPQLELAALIHEADNDVVAIWEIDTKKAVYVHPCTAVGLSALGEY